MVITGIGSRETPEHIQREMTKIGVYCSWSKATLRSGHADGADYAFEIGGEKSCRVYIPWPGFNSKNQPKGKLIVVKETEELKRFTFKYHPKPETLSPAVMRIMARNAVQVLGEDLKTLSNYVVCWTSDGKASGGTGQAMRIAEAHGIPILNMYYKEFDTADKVIARIWK